MLYLCFMVLQIVVCLARLRANKPMARPSRGRLGQAFEAEKQTVSQHPMI